MSFSAVALILSLTAVMISSKAYSLSEKSFFSILDKPVTLKCVVYDTPSFSEYGVHFTAKMLSAKSGNDIFNLEEKSLVFCDGAEIADSIEYGDTVEFKTMLSLPDEANNDGGFSYWQYLNSHGILTYCRTSDFAVKNLGKQGNTSSVLNTIYHLRSSLIKKCDTFFSGDVSAFLKALLLGYKSDLSDDSSCAITRSGISHIISVSGMHLSILMVLLNFFTRRFNFKLKAFILPVLNILFAVFISVITGFSPSVNRAALMLIISHLSNLFYREQDSLQSLSMAVLVLTIINPCAIYDVRLILSAVAVLGIILFNERINHLFKFIKVKSLRENLAVTISAQITTLPIGVFCFNTISIVGILTNIIILPVIPPLMALGVLFLICPFNAITEFIAGGIWITVISILKITQAIAWLPFAQLEISFLYFIRLCAVVTIFAFAVLLILKFNSEINRFLCFSASALLITTLIFTPQSRDFSLSAINTSQGEYTLLSLKNEETVFIHSGGDYIQSLDIENICEFLIQNNIYKLDYFIISNFNKNTANNLLSLARRFKVKCVIAPDYLTHKNAFITKMTFDRLRNSGIPLYLMKKGDSFVLDKSVVFNVLLPDSHIHYSGDNANMVFSVAYANKKILFTGNIKAFEKQLLTSSFSDIKADIIKLPYQGRHTWNDADFLEKVNPSFAFAFTGNKSLPDDTEKILSDLNIKTFTTNIDKTIKIRIKENGEIVIH